MSLATDLAAILSPLVSGRAYPDVTPEVQTFPLLIYQQVGGEAKEFQDNTLPSKNHARIQVVVWAERRVEANEIARAARVALVTGQLLATTYGAEVWDFEPISKLYGSRQDFGIWHDP